MNRIGLSLPLGDILSILLIRLEARSDSSGSSSWCDGHRFINEEWLQPVSLSSATGRPWFINSLPAYSRFVLGSSRSVTV